MAQQKTIYEVLEGEHRLVSQLLEQARRADVDQREDLLAQVLQQLVSHSEAETETFYAALRDHDETRELVEEAESEHRQIAALLDEIDHTAEERIVREQMQQLAESVQHHVQEEEGEIFGRARSVLDDEEARELAARFERCKQRVGEEGLTAEDLLEE